VFLKPLFQRIPLILKNSKIAVFCKAACAAARVVLCGLLDALVFEAACAAARQSNSFTTGACLVLKPPVQRKGHRARLEELTGLLETPYAEARACRARENARLVF
jgi:hypothetical protein